MAKKQLPLDPRQENCLAYYFDPKSSTFSDLKNSALRAGFTESYADNLFHLLPDWLSDAIGQHKMLSKAERNLDQMLDLKTEQPILINKELVVDDNGNAVEVTNPALLRTKADVTMFVAERLGKKKYSQRNESVVVDINLKDIIDAKQVKRIARRILNGNPKGEGKSD